MISIPESPVHFTLDEILHIVCRQLQLSKTLYEDAVGKYTAVGNFLSHSDSILARFNPDIYPQGSMLLGTTNRPYARVEYDIDLVCLLYGCSYDPITVYNLVLQRLQEYEAYRKICEPLKRCIRLNYAGQLHLDILPATPDDILKATCILVPDRKLDCWMKSNPKGFGTWFEGRAEKVYTHGRMVLGVERVPANQVSEMKPPLKRAVQLLKRGRDVVFGDDPDSGPRSVVLTTLAGRFYSGEASVLESLLSICEKIENEIELTSGIMKVYNPTNPEEFFSEAWTPHTYAMFCDFIRNFRTQLVELTRTESLPEISKELSLMFGGKDDPIPESMKIFAEGWNNAKARNEIFVSGSAATLSTTSNARATRVKPHTFYGK